MTVLDMASGTTLPLEFDFCVGADGSYSVIRRQMMKVVRHVQRNFFTRYRTHADE
jgi:kynurenine 3-monooxygenase